MLSITTTDLNLRGWFIPKGGETIAAKPKSAAAAFPELNVSKLNPSQRNGCRHRDPGSKLTRSGTLLTGRVIALDAGRPSIHMVKVGTAIMA